MGFVCRDELEKVLSVKARKKVTFDPNVKIYECVSWDEEDNGGLMDNGLYEDDDDDDGIVELGRTILQPMCLLRSLIILCQYVVCMPAK